jgi:hypothetical protein
MAKAVAFPTTLLITPARLLNQVVATGARLERRAASRKIAAPD